eukprot:TRINITY_DN6152_c1_g1_i1.p1 TRINITY_DN6152_c1_g1~~TRINITY_DN6152_c1_g1_i1.p1  ORF type:complete len:220 (+),score=-11.93 TRINITY_DN6152_c1_g1_i1:53-661(+)
MFVNLLIQINIKKYYNLKQQIHFSIIQQDISYNNNYYYYYYNQIQIKIFLNQILRIFIYILIFQPILYYIINYLFIYLLINVNLLIQLNNNDKIFQFHIVNFLQYNNIITQQKTYVYFLNFYNFIQIKNLKDKKYRGFLQAKKKIQKHKYHKFIKRSYQQQQKHCTIKIQLKCLYEKKKNVNNIQQKHQKTKQYNNIQQKYM